MAMCSCKKDRKRFHYICRPHLESERKGTNLQCDGPLEFFFAQMAFEQFEIVGASDVRGQSHSMWIHFRAFGARKRLSLVLVYRQMLAQSDFISTRSAAFLASDSRLLDAAVLSQMMPQAGGRIVHFRANMANLLVLLPVHDPHMGEQRHFPGQTVRK